MPKKKYGNVEKDFLQVSIEMKKKYGVTEKRRTQLEENQKYYEKAATRYSNTLDKISNATSTNLSNSVIDGFVQNQDNLISFLINSGMDEEKAFELANEFQRDYNLFFQVFAYSIEDMESIGETLNDTELNYAIGLYSQDSGLKMNFLNKEATSQFIRDQQIFGISRDKNGQFVFGMRDDINIAMVQSSIDKVGGENSKNLMSPLLGETSSLQMSLFDTLAQNRVLTAQAMKYNEPGRLEKYNSYLDNLVAKGKISEETAVSRLSKRQQQMDREVTLSRKLEGSYRMLIDQSVKAGMEENDILSQLNGGWKYSDNRAGLMQGDLTKNQMIQLGANPDTASMYSLKLVQDQKYNPQLYSWKSLYNLYGLLIDEEEMGFIGQDLENNGIGDSDIIYQDERVSMQDVVMDELGGAEGDFFGSYEQ